LIRWAAIQLRFQEMTAIAKDLRHGTLLGQDEEPFPLACKN
jgi:hypothetical protein